MTDSKGPQLTKTVLSRRIIEIVHQVNDLLKKEITKNDSFLRFLANFQDTVEAIFRIWKMALYSLK